MTSDPTLIDYLGDSIYALRFGDQSRAIYQSKTAHNHYRIHGSWRGFANAVAWLYENNAAEIDHELKKARGIKKTELPPWNIERI